VILDLKHAPERLSRGLVISGVGVGDNGALKFEDFRGRSRFDDVIV